VLEAKGKPNLSASGDGVLSDEYPVWLSDLNDDESTVRRKP
jgi:hypothetical protein